MLESQGAGHLLSHSTIGILPTNTGSYIHYIRVGGGYYSLSFIPPLRYQTLELGGYPQSHSTIGILVSRAGRLSLPLIPQLEYQYLELGGYHSLSFHNWNTSIQSWKVITPSHSTIGILPKTQDPIHFIIKLGGWSIPFSLHKHAFTFSLNIIDLPPLIPNFGVGEHVQKNGRGGVDFIEKINPALYYLLRTDLGWV